MNRSDRLREVVVDAEQMLRVLTSSVGATVAVVGRDLRFVYVNEAFAAWFDLTPAQLRGRSLQDIYGEYNHARYMPFVQRALAGEKVHYQREVRNPAGVDEWRTICLTPWIGDAGEVLGFVTCALDVQELQVTTQALHTANQRLSSHMENSPLAVIEMDSALRLAHHSHRACELLGWRPQEPAGQPVLALLPPGNIKLRFFVPEAELSGIRLGQSLAARCDGCGAPLQVRVSHIAAQAEYTPPVIYSNAQRARLVFMVEARPEPADAARLHPGQPVDVDRPAAGTP